MQHNEDSFGRKRKKVAEWRDADWIGLEERVDVRGIKSTHRKRFTNEADLLKWIAQERGKRFHGGMQKRFPLAG